MRTDALSRIDAGAEVADAFAAALGGFGPPRELALEFLKAAIPGPARILKYVGVYLVAALAITSAVVLIDGYHPLDVKWVTLGLMSIVILPAAALPFYLERLRI